MTSFRITSVPAGQAPEWVRQQWVGLVFPMHDDPSLNATTGTLGGRPDASNLNGYSVTASIALDVLRQSGPDGERAAEWWEGCSMLPLFPGAGLRFGEQFCELVDSN